MAKIHLLNFQISFFQELSDYSTVLLLHDSSWYSNKAFINCSLLYLQLKDFANALLDFIEAEKCPSTDDNERGNVNPAIHQAIDLVATVHDHHVVSTTTFNTGFLLKRGNYTMQ